LRHWFIEDSLGTLQTGKPELKSYVLREGSVSSFGAICGGGSHGPVGTTMSKQDHLSLRRRPLCHRNRSTSHESAGFERFWSKIDRRSSKRPGKNGGYPSFASDVSCVPGCRGDSVARHSSFKTWSRLGVGDRLRGSHLDQPKYRYALSPRFFLVP